MTTEADAGGPDSTRPPSRELEADRSGHLERLPLIRGPVAELLEKLDARGCRQARAGALLRGMPFIQLERGEGRSVAFTEPTDAPASRRHEILFCPDDAANVDGFARYVAAALNAADAAIVPVTESHRTHLLQELRTQGVDIEGAIERGTCLTQVLENGDIRYRARVDASGRAR